MAFLAFRLASPRMPISSAALLITSIARICALCSKSTSGEIHGVHHVMRLSQTCVYFSSRKASSMMG